MSWFKDYLSFSKRERNAFVMLLVIIAGFIMLPDFIQPDKTRVAVTEEAKQKLASSSTSEKNKIVERQEQSWQTPFTEVQENAPVRLFAFDPNTLNEEGFVSLGVPERTARTIINYRNKGGKFRKPDDLRKIYSLRKDVADRIIPYARIGAEINNTSFYQNQPVEKRNAGSSVFHIDINTADVEQWKSLPGIGEVLSARIIKFRESIGGFSSIDQVAKTYGLRDSTFQTIRPYLKLAMPAVNKVNINTASEQELMLCPAISKDVAQAIVIYRKQKGPFSSIEDLKKIVFINQDLFEKISPCVKTE